MSAMPATWPAVDDGLAAELAEEGTPRRVVVGSRRREARHPLATLEPSSAPALRAAGQRRSRAWSGSAFRGTDSAQYPMTLWMR